MDHIAIDLGGKKSQICRRDASGAILEERSHLTAHLGEYLKTQPKSRVIVETCAEGFGVADAAKKAGHEIRVVPATLVKTLGVGARKNKTDRKDAQVLSQVSCRIDLPSVHIPSAESRELKSMCAARETLVESRTKMINNVRGWLRKSAKQLPSGKAETFTKRMRDNVLELPGFIDRMLTAIEMINPLIKDADKELEAYADKNEVTRRLMSVPGVGPVTAVRYAAAIDDVSRFASAHGLESYLGVVPGEDSSSERKRITSITKAGPTKVRWALVQAAWVAWRVYPDEPMCQWATQVSLRRGKRVAVVGLARKMAGVMYAMWRDGKDYDSKHKSPGQQPSNWDRLNEGHAAQ